MNQELRDQECGQAMRLMVPTNFRRTNDVQQPNPLSTSPLSAWTATHTKYQQQQPLWNKRLLGKKKICVCVSLWKNNVCGRRRKRENFRENCFSFTATSQFIFLKCSFNFTRVHTTQSNLALCLQSQ